MKQLTINWQDLEMAFEPFPDEFRSVMEYAYYFDRESGEVVYVDEEVTGAVNSIGDELEAVLDEVDEWSDDAIRGTDTFQRLSDAEKPAVLVAAKIEYVDSSQYEVIPRFDSHESYEYMRDFIESVSDADIRGRLREAIAQRKPFRRFRDVLADDRRLERQWHEYEIARQRETMIEWLRSIGVEPKNPDVTTYDPPPLPDLRKIMFGEVRRFVRFTRDIQGVRRIALIGSLATDKEFPRDIDMLVTVSEDCDLTPLAQFGRELIGHMNSNQAGADVFLASEDGGYLGRTCPWRECGPACSFAKRLPASTCQTTARNVNAKLR